jgi:hypothetical protein
MNQLSTSISNLFSQLEEAILSITDEQFSSPILLLSGATIGEHMRHILEFYLELNKGYETGIINYDNRKRDHMLQTCKTFAIKTMQEIDQAIAKENIDLTICTSYTNIDGEIQQFNTNYFRELMYNLEHTVHHMAFIRVGISSCSEIAVANDFGVAASTLKFRQLQCAR